MLLKLLAPFAVLLSISCAQDHQKLLSLPLAKLDVHVHLGDDLPDVIQKPLLTAFGHGNNWYKGIDERLIDAVKVFENESSRKVDIPVVISSVRGKYGKDLAGVCIRVTDAKYKAVVIDSDWYAEHVGDHLMVEHAVLHELGHCILDLGHDDKEMWRDGVKLPTSIMNSYSWSKNLISYYDEYRDLYLENLFQ